MFSFKQKSVLTKWCLALRDNPSQFNLKIGMRANCMTEIVVGHLQCENDSHMDGSFLWLARKFPQNLIPRAFEYYLIWQKYVVTIKDFEIVTLAWIIQVGPKCSHMCLHQSRGSIDPDRRGTTQRNPEEAVCPQRLTLEWRGWSQEQLATTGSWKKQEVDSPLGPPGGGGRPADALKPDSIDLGINYHK